MPLKLEMHPRIDKQGEDTAQFGAVSTLALFPLVSPCYSTLLYSYIGDFTLMWSTLHDCSGGIGLVNRLMPTSVTKYFA